MLSIVRLAELDPGRPPLRWLLRSPAQLYRARLGWLLGERFLELTTRGRRSGAPRSVVLEVLGREPATGDFVVASAWGSRAHWLRNLEARPRAEVRVGRQCFPVQPERLSEPAAADQIRAYAKRHRLAYRLFIGPLLLGRRPGRDAAEFAALGRSIPVVVLRRRPADRGRSPEPG